MNGERASLPVLKQPCKSCPFRRTSMPGYLGGGQNQLAENYAAWAKSDQMIACHTSPGYQENDSSTMRPCAGAAMYRNKICKLPRDPSASQACKEVGKDSKDLVFASQEEFLKHHGNEINKRFAESMAKFHR